MIHSDAILFDKNKSNILKDTFISKKAINKGLENVFFNYFVQGATILISKEIKNFILPFPKEVYLHDRYIHLISELFFERIFVNKALIYYRQHGDNQIGAKNTIRELLSKRYFDERDRQLIKIIYNKYGSLLTDDKKKLIEEYFKITDIEKNRFNRFLNLKKSKISIPLKKQISFIVKG